MLSAIYASWQKCYWNYYWIVTLLGPKGITCILVDKDSPGLDFGKKENKVRNQVDIVFWSESFGIIFAKD